MVILDPEKRSILSFARRKTTRVSPLCACSFGRNCKTLTIHSGYGRPSEFLNAISIQGVNDALDQPGRIILLEVYGLVSTTVAQLRWGRSSKCLSP